MQTTFATRWAKIDADTVLRNVLLYTLIAAYTLLVYTTVAGIILLPFGDPQEMLYLPDWMIPLAESHFLLGAFLGIIFGPGIGVTLIATLIVLITTRRVARWLRAGITELFDTPEDDALALISQINPFIAQMNQPYNILPTIAATIAQTLKLPYVEIETQHDADPRTYHVGIHATDATLEHIPLLYHDTKIGELRVASRHKYVQLTTSDLAVLHDLARQVGIALYAAQLTDDLQRARIRLVTAREEERRRIRRDLHDGLGPTLANFAMQLEHACELLPAEADASATILTTLITQAQNTIIDVRRLVYELRPPDLDEFGLVPALQEYLHRRQTKATTLSLDAPPTLPTLPAAVEVATYRIVQEALNNALKHAHAQTITVTLSCATWPPLSTFTVEIAPPLAALRIEIADNGQGISPDHTPGIGLNSMRERAEELGGNCTITSDTTGTRVIVYLPLADHPD